MKLRDFKDSLSQETPPEGTSKPLQALWQDANGNWDRAHKLAQSVENSTGAWVHAYLHRKEGNISNALYWYPRAGKKLPNLSIEEEWDQIVGELLNLG